MCGADGTISLLCRESQKSIISAPKISSKSVRETNAPWCPKWSRRVPQRSPKYAKNSTKTVSESPFESDAGKSRVSDRLKHRKRSSRANGGTVSARAENHRKVSKTMSEGVQKRHREPRKSTPETCPNLPGKIMPQKTRNCRQKTSRRHPRGAHKSSKTDPEIHLRPHGPIIWPKVPRSSHFMPQT